jgi:hypothetical protein
LVGWRGQRKRENLSSTIFTPQAHFSFLPLLKSDNGEFLRFHCVSVSLVAFIHGIVGVSWLIVGSWLGLLVVVAVDPFGFTFVWWKRYVVSFPRPSFSIPSPLLETHIAFLACFF